MDRHRGPAPANKPVPDDADEAVGGLRRFLSLLLGPVLIIAVIVGLFGFGTTLLLLYTNVNLLGMLAGLSCFSLAVGVWWMVRRGVPRRRTD